MSPKMEPSWPFLVPFGPFWRQNMLQRGLQLELQGRSKLHLGPSWRQEGACELKPKNGDHFPRKLSKNLIFDSKNEPPVILKRICRICRKWGVGVQVRTSLPYAPGARMTVVTQTSSNKSNSRLIHDEVTTCLAVVDTERYDPIACTSMCRGTFLKP